MSYNTYPQNPFPPNSENAGGGGSPYVLPVASAETLGGVKVGGGLSIDSNGVLSAPIPSYSETEQATGQKWIDGKDIYFKVVNLSEVLTVTSQTWTDTGVDSTCIDSLVDAKFYDANSVNFAMNVAKMNGETAHITVMQFRNAQVGIIRMILWYTKATT